MTWFCWSWKFAFERISNPFRKASSSFCSRTLALALAKTQLGSDGFIVILPRLDRVVAS